MGMSTHVVAFREADLKFKEMKKIWEMCDSNDIVIPDEVDAYFDGEWPKNMEGVEININEAVSEYNFNCQQGFQVDLSKLPKGVRTIRVYNSY